MGKPHLSGVGWHVVSTLTIRFLLDRVFISGDGNFKLQRRRKAQAKNVYTAAASTFRASLFGDGGYWSEQALYQQYISDGKPAPHVEGSEKVLVCTMG